jgi:hypothetical protein
MKQYKSMKFLSKRLFAMGLLLSMAIAVQAQETAESEPNNLNEQYQQLKQSSNNYQEYKVVRERNLDALWKNVQDTMAARQRQMVEARQRIDEQQLEIRRLSQEIQERNKIIDESEHEQAHIQVLGMDVRKESYVTFNWVVIGILVLLLAIALYNYQNSKRFAVRKRTEYEQLEHEFQDFKLRSREKETKLMRDLQTERNTIEDLNQQLVNTQRGKSGV